MSDTPESKPSPGPWLPEGAIGKAILDPQTVIVLKDGDGGAWTIAALATLATKLYPEMAAMLRGLEWRMFGGACPVCDGAKPVEGFATAFHVGHDPSCRLAALLRELP